MKASKLIFIRTPEQFRKLAELGAEFGHSIAINEGVQYVAFDVDGEWIGFGQFITAPTVLFAWNPERTAKHRHGMLDACKKVAGWMKIRFGRGFTAVPEKDCAFTKDVMEKLGMQDTGHKLYLTRN